MFNFPQKTTAYMYIVWGLAGIMDFAILFWFGGVMNFGNVLPGIVGVILFIYLLEIFYFKNQ